MVATMRPLFEVVADFERRKIIETLETVNWKPDRRGRKARHPAVHAQSKDQALEHRGKAQGNQRRRIAGGVKTVVMR
jgi:hypothetical protein